MGKISGATELRGPKLVLDIAFGLPAHQPSRPKHERLPRSAGKLRDLLIARQAVLKHVERGGLRGIDRLLAHFIYSSQIETLSQRSGWSKSMI